MINGICINLTELIPLLDVNKIKMAWKLTHSEVFNELEDINNIQTIEDLNKEINSHEDSLIKGWGAGLIPKAYALYILCEVDDHNCYLVYDKDNGIVCGVTATIAKKQIVEIIKNVAKPNVSETEIFLKINYQNK